MYHYGVADIRPYIVCTANDLQAFPANFGRRSQRFATLQKNALTKFQHFCAFYGLFPQLRPVKLLFIFNNVDIYLNEFKTRTMKQMCR